MLIEQLVRDMGGPYAYYVQGRNVEDACELGGHTFGYSFQGKSCQVASVRFTMDGSEIPKTWFDVRATELTGAQRPNVITHMENRDCVLDDTAVESALAALHGPVSPW